MAHIDHRSEWDNWDLWGEWTDSTAEAMMLPNTTDGLTHNQFESHSTLIQKLSYPNNEYIVVVNTYDTHYHLTHTRRVVKYMLRNLLDGKSAWDFTRYQYNPVDNTGMRWVLTDFRYITNREKLKCFAYLENGTPALLLAAPLSEMGLAWVREQCQRRITLLATYLLPSPPDSGAESN